MTMKSSVGKKWNALWKCLPYHSPRIGYKISTVDLLIARKRRNLSTVYRIIKRWRKWTPESDTFRIAQPPNVEWVLVSTVNSWAIWKLGCESSREGNMLVKIMVAPPKDDWFWDLLGAPEDYRNLATNNKELSSSTVDQEISCQYRINMWDGYKSGTFIG